MGEPPAGDSERSVEDAPGSEPGPSDPSETVTDGGGEGASRRSELTHAIPDAVIPRLEVPETLSELIVPRIEEPDAETVSVGQGRERLGKAVSRTSDVIPRIEEPEPPGPIFEAGIVPTFEEPVGGGTLPVPGAGSTAIDTVGQPVDDLVADDDDDWGITGPEYDQEMPLADHIEEMIKRLAVVIVVAGSVTLVTFPFADQIINFMWYSILPESTGAVPRVYGPLEFLLTRIKVASLMGLIVALPVVVYETYAFMRPGLYRHERRYYLAAIPTSLVLALIGVAFAYFIVLPALFTYFLVYSQDAGEIAFALAQTFDLMLILMAYLAIVFQIPLFIMLAIMMGLTTRQWLADKRLYFWGAFLGLAFISSPDPTGMAPIIIALTMVALFEGTIGLLKWIGK